jgi:hypothetical protein
MENRTPILDELQSIAPAVAQISPLTPYQVPARYFEGLAGLMLQLVKAADAVPPVLQNTINTPYAVPQGYFEGLATQILQRVKAASDAEVPVVLAQAKTNPYTVPQGYFEGLANTLLNRIKADTATTVQEELEMLSPLLNKIGKKTPFSTPAGYFDELSENAVSGAKAIEFVNGELENLSPLMSSLKGKQVYTVPAGYFHNLATEVLGKVQVPQPAKVVTMNFGRRAMQYAAAAVVAGVIAIGGWMYLNKGNNPTTPGTSAVAATDIDKVSDAELQSYLEGETVALAGALAVNTSSTELNADDLKDMLADVPDEDLQKYIDQFSNAKDILTN